MDVKRWITWTCIGLLITAPAMGAESAAEPAYPEAPLPTAPSAPPQLGSTNKIPSIGCRREFTLGGKAYQLDSWNREDGERLRPHLAGLPEALSELDHYQETPPKLRKAAFITTAGLLLVVTGLILRSSTGARSGTSIGNLTGVAGIGIAAGGVAYGLTLLTSNESHLERAVEIHNQAHPARPIEIVVGARAVF